MSASLRIALLSTAHVHTTDYADALRHVDGASLAAIWDDDNARGRAFAQARGIPFLPDLDAPTAWDAFDAVIIASENAKHAALCLAACRAGKHVLCEKPLATRGDDAAAMIAAAEHAGVLLATAFDMRHNLPAQAVKNAIDQGRLGEVLAIRATNHGQLPPGWFSDPALSGGGAVMGHTVHVVDLARWYLNDEPVEVYAEISDALYHAGVEDIAFLTITFRSGVVLTLDPSWSRPPSFPLWGDLTMEIAGTAGVISLDAFAQNVVKYPARTARTEWLPWSAEGKRSLLEDFVGAIRNGHAPAATGRDGARALAVALAAYASAKCGQPQPVEQ
jgi:UDP-N-acetylglucosamine 3-dehydrogenase